MKEVVTFFLSGKEYGADVSEIQGIENYVEYAKEPGLSDGFLGIVSIRDEWVPLLNLKKKLVLPPVPVTGETKYLVFQLPQGKAAVLRILFRRMAMKYRISRHLCTRKRRRMPTLW